MEKPNKKKNYVDTAAKSRRRQQQHHHPLSRTYDIIHIFFCQIYNMNMHYIHSTTWEGREIKNISKTMWIYISCIKKF